MLLIDVGRPQKYSGSQEYESEPETDISSSHAGKKAPIAHDDVVSVVQALFLQVAAEAR
jgi:hypothetical protein